ncbi:MAG: hypothetical protein ACXVPQ_04840 [Bacteroidia bacterium]
MFNAKKIKIAFFLIAAAAAFSCKKKTQTTPNNNIPYVAVNVTIYPNDPLYFKLQTPGGWVYYNNAGLNGIIIYRKTQTDFIALERTSTYLPDDPNARVKVQSDNFTLKDSISGSKWQMVDGSVINGPAVYGLKVYLNSFDGNALKILN